MREPGTASAQSAGATESTPAPRRRPARTPGPRRTWAGPLVSRDFLLSTVTLAGLVGFAALVRWPQLQMIPPFTDETEESLRAFAIATGRLQTLVNDEPYIGALWNYVVAGLFLAFGRNPELPRLASLAAGALTVGMTFVVGRHLYGPLAGIVAALLLAANGAHILVNSHIAWSNCVTPLFTMTAIWLLLRVLDRPTSYIRLALAGVAWGLALQTHPTVIVMIFGVAVYALWRDPKLPLRPSAWIGLLAAVAAYSNVLIYNLQSGMATFTEAQRVGSEYGAAGMNADRYGKSLLGLLMLLTQSVGGVVEPRTTPVEYVQDPQIVAAYALLVATWGWAVWRRQWLVLLVSLPTFLLIPALNQRWQPILASRYIMPLLPLLLVTFGGLVADLSARCRMRPSLAWGSALAMVAVFGLGHLLALRAYYRAEIAEGRTNDGPWQMVRMVQEQRRAREVLLVPAEVRRLPTGGGGSWGRALNFLATVRDIPGTVARFDPQRPIRACDVTAVVLRREERAQAVNPPPGTPRHEGYWLIRPEPLGDATAQPGAAMMTRPYVLPWRQRSLFDASVPTFETGCDPS